MTIVKKVSALSLLLAAVLIGCLFLNTEKASANHFNWSPPVCPPGPGGLQTGFIVGFDPRYSGKTYTVTQGTQYILDIIHSEATICPFASYNDAWNAEIVTFNKPFTLALGNIPLGNLPKWGGVNHQSVLLQIATGFYGVGFHNVCFDWYGTAFYPHLGRSAQTEPSTFCMGLNITAPAPTHWNYQIQNVDPTAVGPYGAHRAGFNLTFRSRVWNIGTATGPNYTHRINIHALDRPYLIPGTNATFTGQPGLPPGHERFVERTHTIATGTADGNRLCFGSSVSRAAGQATPTLINTWDLRNTGQKCYTVYNRRFGLSKPTVTPRQVTASPGENVEFDFQVCNTNAALARSGFTGPPGPGATHAETPASPGFLIAVPQITTNPGNLTGVSETTQMARTPAGGCVTITRTYSIPLTANPGDLVCPSVTVAPTYGWSDGFLATGSDGTNTGPGGVCSGGGTVVVHRPYVKTFGSDILAGGFFSEAPPAGTVFNPSTNLICSNYDPSSPQFNAASGAQIRSWTRLAPGGFVGASNQFATYSMGRTHGFGSANNQSLPIAYPGRPASILTFSNGGASGPYTAAQAHLFGNWHTTPKCIPNYYDMLAKSGPGVNSISPGLIGSVPPGQHYVNSSTFISGLTITGPTTLIVNGDAVLAGNIQYAGDATGWASPASIPFLTLVVRGNIIVGDGVTRLDGLYIAQPNSSLNGGVIHTCSAHVPPRNGNLAEGTCPAKLHVFGAFVAQRVNFWRTSGSLSDIATPASDQVGPAAEVFSFSPEMYLADPNYIWATPPPSTAALPGIDQIKELPPVR